MIDRTEPGLLISKAPRFGKWAWMKWTHFQSAKEPVQLFVQAFLWFGD